MSITNLWRVARPQFLICGLALYFFGAAWAILLGAPFLLSRLVLGYLVLMPAHLSISYSNDYFDVDVDKHDKPTLFSGGSGVLVDQPSMREPARWTAIALISLSLALGVLFQIVYSFPPWFFAFVVVGNLLGWFYSAPPLRLAYRGWGEPSMVLSVGLLIPGFGFLVAGGQLNQDGLLLAIPLMLYGMAFILTVEIPDMEADRLGRKMTWVARWGRGFGFTVIAAALLLASLYFFGLPLLASRAYPLDFRVLGALSLLPLAAGGLGLVTRPVGRRAATRVVYALMITLAAFCALADAYMVYLAVRQVP